MRWVRACASSAADVRETFRGESAPPWMTNLRRSASGFRKQPPPQKKKRKAECRQRLLVCFGCIAHKRSATLLGITSTASSPRKLECSCSHYGDKGDSVQSSTCFGLVVQDTGLRFRRYWLLNTISTS